MDTKIISCSRCGKELCVNKHSGNKTMCKECNLAHRREKYAAKRNQDKSENNDKTNKTSITVEYPFSECWDDGYLVFSKKENRRIVILRRRDTGETTTTSYARYIIGVKNKKILSDNEQVDHIDGNKLNDSIENLQILSIPDHVKKSSSEAHARADKNRITRVPRHGTLWEHVKYGCCCELCMNAYRDSSRKYSKKYRSRIKYA